MKPTYFPSVPRSSRRSTPPRPATSRRKGLKKAIFNWAVGVGKKVRDRERAGKPVGWLLRKQYEFADKQVLSKIRALFGGNLKLAVTGAAPINPEILRFFDAAGVLVVEGWGMTETSTAATISRPEAFKFGTVGVPFNSCEIRIADDGEILVKGPNVFQGYYKNEEATKETIVDGWLHTGDIGEFDEDGYLKITGRKKASSSPRAARTSRPPTSRPRSSRAPTSRRPSRHRRPPTLPLGAGDLGHGGGGEAGDRERLARRPRRAREEPRDARADPGPHRRDEREVRARRAGEEVRDLPADLSQEGGSSTPTLKVKRNVVADKYRVRHRGPLRRTSRVTPGRPRLLQGDADRGRGRRGDRPRAARGRGRPHLLPAADGGEERWTPCWRRWAESLTAPAHDLLGRPLEARYARLADGRTAVVEVAQASGLSWWPSPSDAEAASSAGTGELIAAAAEGGAARAGRGGGQRHNRRRRGRDRGGQGGRRARQSKLEVLCDVSIPFERAAEVFAPQKGADPQAVARLTERLTARAGALPRDPRGRPMTGAAGGLSGGLWAEFGARPRSRCCSAARSRPPRGRDRGGDRRSAPRLQSFEGKLVGEVARRRAAGAAACDRGPGRPRRGGRPRSGLASATEAGTLEAIEAAARELAGSSGIACRRPPLAGPRRLPNACGSGDAMTQFAD